MYDEHEQRIVMMFKGGVTLYIMESLPAIVWSRNMIHVNNSCRICWWPPSICRIKHGADLLYSILWNLRGKFFAFAFITFKPLLKFTKLTFFLYLQIEHSTQTAENQGKNPVSSDNYLMVSNALLSYRWCEKNNSLRKPQSSRSLVDNLIDSCINRATQQL